MLLQGTEKRCLASTKALHSEADSMLEGGLEDGQLPETSTD